MKYLIPKEFKVCSFISNIRRSMTLNKDVAIYLFVQNKLIKSDQVIGDVYNKHKDEDNFLYMEVGDLPSYGQF